MWFNIAIHDHYINMAPMFDVRIPWHIFVYCVIKKRVVRYFYPSNAYNIKGVRAVNLIKGGIKDKKVLFFKVIKEKKILSKKRHFLHLKYRRNCNCFCMFKPRYLPDKKDMHSLSHCYSVLQVCFLEQYVTPIGLVRYDAGCKVTQVRCFVCL